MGESESEGCKNVHSAAAYVFCHQLSIWAWTSSDGNDHVSKLLVSVKRGARGPSFDVCAVYLSTRGWHSCGRTSVLLVSTQKGVQFELRALEVDKLNTWNISRQNIDRWRFTKGDWCATFKLDHLWFPLPLLLKKLIWTSFFLRLWTDSTYQILLRCEASSYSVVFNKMAQSKLMLLSWYPVYTFPTSSFNKGFTLIEENSLVRWIFWKE